MSGIRTSPPPPLRLRRVYAVRRAYAVRLDCACLTECLAAGDSRNARYPPVPPPPVGRRSVKPPQNDGTRQQPPPPPPDRQRPSKPGGGRGRGGREGLTDGRREGRRAGLAARPGSARRWRHSTGRRGSCMAPMADSSGDRPGPGWTLIRLISTASSSSESSSRRSCTRPRWTVHAIDTGGSHGRRPVTQNTQQNYYHHDIGSRPSSKCTKTVTSSGQTE